MSARDVIENCHRRWRGFWPRAFTDDLFTALDAAGYEIIKKRSPVQQQVDEMLERWKEAKEGEK